MKKRIEVCFGCSIYSKTDVIAEKRDSCLNLIYNYTQCPCTNCLIKSMCEHECPDFEKFYKIDEQKWNLAKELNNERT